MKVFTIYDDYVIAETYEEAVEIHDEAKRKARGKYQRALLCGRENWSGSSLRGKAKNYGARYAASRENLLSRIDGVTVIDKTQRGKRILILGGTVEEVEWLTTCLTHNILFDDEKWHRRWVGAVECGVRGAAEVIRNLAIAERSSEKLKLHSVDAVAE